MARRSFRRPKQGIHLRSAKDLYNVLSILPNYLRRADLTVFERAFIEAGIVPRNFLLKHAPSPASLDESIATLLAKDQIVVLRDFDEDGRPLGEFFKLAHTPQPKPFRAGRYVTAEHPSVYQSKGGSHPNVNVPMFKKDRNFLWYLGEGRLSEGLQMALNHIRKHMDIFREDYPQFSDLPKDVL